MTFNEQIKFKREEAGMTQEELAEKLGVSRQAVSKWELGAAEPRGKNRSQLIALLSMDMPVEQSPESTGKLAHSRLIYFFCAFAVAIIVIAAILAVRFIHSPSAEEDAAFYAIDNIRFYDSEQNEVLPEANWLTAYLIDSILIDYTGSDLQTVKVFFTPSGTETAEDSELLITKPVTSDGAVLLPADSLHRDSLMGHIQIELDFGSTTVKSELINIIYDPDV